jgi:hypothetical protein
MRADDGGIIAPGQAIVDAKVLRLRPSEPGKSVEKLPVRGGIIRFRSAYQKAQPLGTVGLLRSHRERPYRRSAEKGDEFASPHAVLPKAQDHAMRLKR